MQMSRSVTTPHTFSWSSTTGRNPQLPFHINAAASPRFARGVPKYGVPIMTSFTFMAPSYPQTHWSQVKVTFHAPLPPNNAHAAPLPHSRFPSGNGPRPAARAIPPQSGPLPTGPPFPESPAPATPPTRLLLPSRVAPPSL